MRRPAMRPVLYVLLAVAIVVFYITFVTARTYYNPVATAVIVLLGITIAVSGVTLSRLPKRDGSDLLQHRLVMKSVSLYRVFFLVALLLLSSDVAVTSYAIFVFGTGVEANVVVVGLVSSGNLLAWMGQQFAPILIAGGLFALFKHLYVRAILTFYTLGTVGYALATVLNDVVVLYALYGSR
ncbi:MAG: hypothetical protein LYZ70_07915 [Nitrososphaerales archaeon]|nr:hypothetical protein [Nitrososphaerales archaeon]